MVWFLTFRSYGTHCADTDALLNWRRRRMRWGEFELSSARRAVVLNAVEGVCRSRGWDLLAAHIRATHVHVVVSSDAEPETMLRYFKTHASLALRAANLANDGHVWARGGYWRWLTSPERIQAAVRYALDRQGEPMAVYDGTMSSHSIAND